ncbi:MAG TPA: GNAT family N-acetyltransferase [Actinoallomurus sp.]
MDEARLQESADRNVLGMLRHFALHSTGAELHEDASLLLTTAPTPMASAYHDAAIRLVAEADPHEVLARTREFGRRHERRMVLWASDYRDADLTHAATALDMPVLPSVTGMWLAAPPQKPGTLPGVEIIEVVDETGVSAFEEIHESIFTDNGQPTEGVAHFATAGALLSANARAFVLHLDGQPAACAMAVCTGREAGIYWVGTRRSTRRQGLGEIATRVAAIAAFELGADIVVLQATNMAVALYRRIGFTSFATYLRHLVG